MLALFTTKFSMVARGARYLDTYDIELLKIGLSTAEGNDTHFFFAA